MRVVAGKYRSRLIVMPKGIRIRPTQDRVRQAIFNILGRLCIGAKVLDLYSGSGAFGIEAISRGAKEVVFVDSNIECIKTIKKNLRNLEINDNIIIIKSDAIKALKKLDLGKKIFDLIFLDPPYYKNMVEKTLIAINNCDTIYPSAVIIAEHFKKDKALEVVGRLHLMRQRMYGDTTVSFYGLSRK